MKVVKRHQLNNLRKYYFQKNGKAVEILIFTDSCEVMAYVKGISVNRTKGEKKLIRCQYRNTNNYFTIHLAPVVPRLDSIIW